MDFRVWDARVDDCGIEAKISANDRQIQIFAAMNLMFSLIYIYIYRARVYPWQEAVDDFMSSGYPLTTLLVDLQVFCLIRTFISLCVTTKHVLALPRAVIQEHVQYSTHRAR